MAGYKLNSNGQMVDWRGRVLPVKETNQLSFDFDANNNTVTPTDNNTDNKDNK